MDDTSDKVLVSFIVLFMLVCLLKDYMETVDYSTTRRLRYDSSYQLVGHENFILEGLDSFYSIFKN